MDFEEWQLEMMSSGRAYVTAAQFMPIEEFADLLGVSVRKVYRMKKAGLSPPRVRRGHRLGYRRDVVAAWLVANGRSVPASEP